MIHAVKDVFQRGIIKMTGQLSVMGGTDDAGFFTDNQHDGIGSLGNAESGAMSGAEIAADGTGFTEREEAGTGDDACITDNDCTVVQRGVGLEDVFQQGSRDDAVQPGTGLDDFF